MGPEALKYDVLAAKGDKPGNVDEVIHAQVQDTLLTREPATVGCGNQTWQARPQASQVELLLCPGNRDYS